ncbi:hypothetical protein ACFE04_017221 [Oxalis oulophora]
MPSGTVEVLLIGAKSLQDSDFLSSMDPYVLITCRTQEQKSSVASGQGTEPQWNETFVFTVQGSETPQLSLKIMDKDTFTSDDFVGEAVIPLEPLFENGSLPPASYNVVKDEEYCGEIKVGLTFTPTHTREYQAEEEETYGGWKDSAQEY